MYFWFSAFGILRSFIIKKTARDQATSAHSEKAIVRKFNTLLSSLPVRKSKIQILMKKGMEKGMIISAISNN